MRYNKINGSILAIALALGPAACTGAGEGAEEGEREEGPPSEQTYMSPSERPAGAEPSTGTETRTRPGPAAEEERLQRFTLPAGTTFRVTLDQELGTKTHEAGDRFTVAVGESLMAGDEVAVPARSTIRGTVTAVQHSEAGGKPAVIKLAFDELVLDDRTFPIRATLLEANPELESRTSTAEGAAKVGGAAAAGAIIGRIIGGDTKSTLIGAAVGAAAGTAVVLGTRDVDAVLPAGSEMRLRLDRDLTVERRVAAR